MYKVKKQQVPIEDGLQYLKDAYRDFEIVNQRKYGYKKVPTKIENEVNREINNICIRVENIMLSCPQIKGYIDYKDVFYNRVFIGNDLPNIIDRIEKDISQS